MVERQTRDLEVRVRVPVQVQIFLLKFDKESSGLFVELYWESEGIKHYYTVYTQMFLTEIRGLALHIVAVDLL